MDVHVTKLVRTLFRTQREWNAVPPNKGLDSDMNFICDAISDLRGDIY